MIRERTLTCDTAADEFLQVQESCWSNGVYLRVENDNSITIASSDVDALAVVASRIEELGVGKPDPLTTHVDLGADAVMLDDVEETDLHEPGPEREEDEDD